MIDKYVKEMSEKYHNKVEELTKEQFEDALLGAIKSGDFVRYVQGYYPNEKQGMSYIPFREKTGLQMKVMKLKRLLLLTDESVSNITVSDTQVRQWNEFIKDFPEEA